MTFRVTPEILRDLRFRFEDAAVKCSERGLYQAAKWAAEMLNALVTLDEEDDDTLSTLATPGDRPAAGAAHDTTAPFQSVDPDEACLERREAHHYILAKSYFDAREYDRCSAVFLPATSAALPLGTRPPKPRATPRRGMLDSPRLSKAAASAQRTATKGSSQTPYPRLSQRSLFLALYSKYLAGEKRKDEESEMVLGPVDGGLTVNRELASIAQGLSTWFADRKAQGLEDKSQGWLEYLYGVVLLKAKNEKDAEKWLIRSVHLNPYNWSAWQELNDLIGSIEDVRLLRHTRDFIDATLTPCQRLQLKHVITELPENIMTLLFHLYCSQELYQTTEDIYNTLVELEDLFPTSAFLKTQRALLFYHSKDFDEAAQLFSEILSANPYRLDGLDHYSNILYVMSARPQLAFIAQLATATDRFRPETCCVVGNYYSLKSDHEKAVLYFRRALTLDRNFLSAWTLMGHEYIEMKNTHAAIESYRRAVDVNQKDYRAWYGLGQAYEVLDMVFYALFYYERAAALRPYDPKMWQAVGSCYAKMERLDQGIHALKRAIVAGSYYEPSGSALSQPFGTPEGRASAFNLPTAGAASSSARKILDPDILHQIALLYERSGDLDTAASYMELTMQQESGTMLDEDDDEIDTAEDGGNGKVHGEASTKQQRRDTSASRKNVEQQDIQIGTGVTASTSKARLWLAKWSLQRDDLTRANQLASELCQDGYEVDEAKAIMRDIHSRRAFNQTDS
ncbi:Anaphase-promoting complex subunit 23 [Ascosphaera acerosa]|nr:Anaphase-promoting complex subunit 23 [Ascosphaera acerosa]